MNFAEALREMRNGYRVARQGWNGKGMWIAILPLWPSTWAVAEGPDLVELRVDPVISMRTAQRTIQPGWLASQADLLAEDWVIVG